MAQQSASMFAALQRFATQLTTLPINLISSIIFEKQEDKITYTVGCQPNIVWWVLDFFAEGEE